MSERDKRLFPWHRVAAVWLAERAGWITVVDGRIVDRFLNRNAVSLLPPGLVATLRRNDVRTIAQLEKLIKERRLTELEGIGPLRAALIEQEVRLLLSPRRSSIGRPILSTAVFLIVVGVVLFYKNSEFSAAGIIAVLSVLLIVEAIWRFATRASSLRGLGMGLAPALVLIIVGLSVQTGSSDVITIETSRRFVALGSILILWEAAKQIARLGKQSWHERVKILDFYHFSPALQAVIIAIALTALTAIWGALVISIR